MGLSESRRARSRRNGARPRGGSAPTLAAIIGLLGLVQLPPSLASDPPSHQVTVPTAENRTVRVSWSGTIPPGASPSNDCADSVAADPHSINLIVPGSLYSRLAVRATFSITFDGPTDQIITVITPDGSAVTSDNGFVDADESVGLVNPTAGSYEVLACSFASALPQTYTGSLELRSVLVGICRPDAIGGIDLQSASVPQIQAALDSGSMTSRRLTEAYLRRIAEYDSGGPKLNAVRELNPTALAQADALDAERGRSGKRGPLHGIPVLLKDNIGTIDVPTTAGSIALEGSIPLRDAFLTQRLREAGAIILGKANLSEFANWVDLSMPSGYSSLGGQVINPYHFGDPSGSSSGSGVGAAMALATVTVGTETSGSILSPSLANSVVGIKPTVGLVSRAGIIPLAPTFDTPGPITRNVTDAAIVLGAMTGLDPRDATTAESQGRLPPNSDYRPFLRADGLRGARIGVSDADRSSLDPEQQKLWDKALATLERLGATIVLSDTDTLSTTRNVGLVEIAVIPNEFKHYLNRYLAEETVPNLRVKTLTEIIEFNSMHPDKVKYGQNLLQISDLTLGNVDEPTAVASRTAAIEGSRAAIAVAMLVDDLDAILSPGNVNVNIGAAALYPSIAVPAGYTEEGTQPFGITFLGPAYSEPTLISFAYAFEQGSAPRIRPSMVNRGLCTARAAAAPTVGGTKTSKPEAAPDRGGLPATGVGAAWMAAAALACCAIALACWLRRTA